jgi:Putative cell wall-binding domain
VGFNAENIISDALFYDGRAMTAAEIQSFLDAKIGTCQNGKCLNVLSITTESRKAYYSQTTGDLVCGDLNGGTMRASEFIYRVQVACGVSAKVILVTMQKEQGLATSKAPTDTELRRAMGHLCSDTAPCETAAAGISNQIFGGTEQLKKYKATAFGKQPGRNWVGYNPNSACGGTYLNIKNYATAALYNFTPYQPNAAALAAGSGLGDSCSSYGNRNFYTFYTAWFGSTQADPCKVPAAANTITAGGVFVTTDALNGRSAPSASCPTVPATTFAKGTLVTRLATYGSWWKVSVDAREYWVHSDYLSEAPIAYTTSRIAGETRYETSVSVSKTRFPNGASVVFLVSGEDYPDALTAAAAAGASGAALLLSQPDALRDSVAGEIRRLAPKTVVIIGGTDRISEAVYRQVAGLAPTASVSRIAGADRFQTSLMLAERYFPTSSSAYVVTGRKYPDAIVAAALGAAKGVPVLLVDGLLSSVPTTTITTLRKAGVQRVVIAGSEASVSAGVASSLTKAGLTVKRFGGATRYETSSLLNADAYPNGAGRAFLATGEGFADALTGTVLASASASPLFLTFPTCLDGATRDWLQVSGVGAVTLIGGIPSLNGQVASSVRC